MRYPVAVGSVRVKGLLFDLGGTLFSYTRGARSGQALLQAATELGIEVEPRELGAWWRQASESTMARYAPSAFFLHRDLFRDTLNAFAESFGRAVDAAVADRFMTAQRQAVIEHLPLRDDCRDTLAALKARGLYLAIVSNIDDDYLQPLVSRHGLDAWLDDHTSSEEARSCKPHMDIFHYALAKAGLGIDDALFVGDSLHHDVAGASAVGMRSIHISEPGIETPLTTGLVVTARPTFEVNCLADIIHIVDALNDPPDQRSGNA
jgi:2-haloalkanoic acid dehalogenase type II